MLTELKREEFKNSILESIDEGIAKLHEYHLTRLAEESNYNDLGIGYTMGIWDNTGMGDDHIDLEAIKARLGRKIGKSPDAVLEHLERLVQERRTIVSKTFDPNPFKENLELLKQIATERISKAKSIHAAFILRCSCHDFIYRCINAHPEDTAPDIETERQELSWIGTKEEDRSPFSGHPLTSEPQTHNEDFEPECDDEIPF